MAQGVILGTLLFLGCDSKSSSYVIVKHERRPTVVFKTYSDAETDAYVIKHGHIVIEAECAHEAHPSWNPSDPIYFHCPLTVDKPMDFTRFKGVMGGREGLRYTENGQTTELAIISEEAK